MTAWGEERQGELRAENLDKPASVSNRPIRAVLFDAVGTLFRSETPISRVYARAGQAWGSRLAEAEIAARFTPAFFRHFGRVTPGEAESLSMTSESLERQRWRAVVEDVFRDAAELTPASLDSLFEHLWGHFARGGSWRLFEDVESTWSDLHRQGVVMGIASNYDSRLLQVLRELPPLDQCRHVFHSAGVGHAKPGREFFRAIERTLGMSGEELLFVGDDHNNDFLGARNAGWQALWLVRGEHAVDEPRRISSLREVVAMVAARGVL